MQSIRLSPYCGFGPIPESMNMTASSRADQRQRFIFDAMPVRGIHVQLHSVWQHIVQRKQYPAAIEQALGELLAAGVLLASNLKFDGTLILQVQGTGCLKMLVVEATADRTCRATARWDEQAQIPAQMNLRALLGEGGVFVMTLQPKEGEAWQGIVALEGDSIAQMLMNYMARSEQLDTHLSLACSDEAVGGLLLQRLPEQAIEADAWQHVHTLAQTVTAAELTRLDGPDLLYRLFHETPPRVFEPENMEFACTCSREKTARMLLLLGGQEVGEVLAEQGSVEIACDFCHQKYVFDEDDANELFGMDIIAAVRHEQTQ